MCWMLKCVIKRAEHIYCRWKYKQLNRCQYITLINIQGKYTVEVKKHVYRKS